MPSRKRQPGLSRREFLRAAGTALAAGAAANVLAQTAAWAQSSQPTGKPNIVFILADDLGIEGLGCFGSQSYATPNLDALAAGGVRFMRAYSNPLCSPTRVATMTGMYNCRNYHGWGVFDPRQQRTFAHVLKQAGYATALAGKWQFDDFSKHPDHIRDCGFDEYMAWMWHGTQRYWNPGLWHDGKGVPDTAGKYGPDIECEFLIDFVRRHKDQPFLAYWPMTLVHAPFDPPPDLTGGSAVSSPSNGSTVNSPSNGAPPKADAKAPAPAETDPPADKAAPKKGKGNKDPKIFPAMVAYMDKLIGKLLATLEELHLRENTLIVFTGDNGNPRQVNTRFHDSPLQGGKGTMADTGSHVPMIANWKGRSPAGAVCDDLVDPTDYFATLAEAAGAAVPKDRTIDGRSFLPQARGEKGSPRDWALVELGPERFLMDKRYKLDKAGRLFDLKDAPLQEPQITEANLTDESRSAKQRLQKVFTELPPALTIGGGPSEKGDG